MNKVAVMWVDLVGGLITLQGWNVILTKIKMYPFEF